MTVREAQLNRTFVELADTLVSRFDVAELLALLHPLCGALEGGRRRPHARRQPGTLRVVGS